MTDNTQPEAPDRQSVLLLTVLATAPGALAGIALGYFFYRSEIMSDRWLRQYGAPEFGDWALDHPGAVYGWGVAGAAIVVLVAIIRALSESPEKRAAIRIAWTGLVYPALKHPSALIRIAIGSFAGLVLTVAFPANLHPVLGGLCAGLVVAAWVAAAAIQERGAHNGDEE